MTGRILPRRKIKLSCQKQMATLGRRMTVSKRVLSSKLILESSIPWCYIALSRARLIAKKHVRFEANQACSASTAWKLLLIAEKKIPLCHVSRELRRKTMQSFNLSRCLISWFQGSFQQQRLEIIPIWLKALVLYQYSAFNTNQPIRSLDTNSMRFW